MSDIPRTLAELVVLRARNRCEYCRLSQPGQEATFHTDHVTPRAAGGPTEPDNLALACVSCSLRKWARQTAPDPDTGEDAPLFNPRTQVWAATSGGTGRGWCRSPRPAGRRPPPWP